LPIRVLIADDHPVVRRGLAQMVKAEADMELAGECSTAAEVMDSVISSRCDVLILDVALPDGNGIELLAALKERRPSLPVLILSIYPPEQFAARAVRAGASGYLTKESATEELIQAIRTVHTGRRYLTQETADALAEAVRSQPAVEPGIELLSMREREVLKRYASGRTVTEISDEMQVSVRTVSTYKTRILEKLNLNSNADLIAWAIRNDLTGQRADPPKI